MSGFTWIPFYKELAEKLLEYKDRRDELVKFVYSSLDKTDYLSMEDGKTPIKDIDPFTFFGIFNRRTSKENRVKNAKEINGTDTWNGNGQVALYNKYVELIKNFSPIEYSLDLYIKFLRKTLEDYRRLEEELENNMQDFASELNVNS